MRTGLLLVALLLSGAANAEGDAPPIPTQGASWPSGVRCSQVSMQPPEALMKDSDFKEASVVVEIEILPPGEVGNILIKESSGNREWEQSVVKAVKAINCRIGAPFETRAVFRQAFSLKVK